MSLILLAIGAMFNGSSKQWDGCIRLYAFLLGIVYDIVIIGKLLKQLTKGGWAMGEIADMMIEGGGCSWCGVIFRKDYGYPVLCKSCWDNATPEERKGFQKASER